MTATADLATPVDELVETPTRLSNQERCDSCDARAYWEIGFSSGPLNFCNHHFNRFSVKFADLPVTKIDWQDGFLAVDYSRKSETAFS